MPGSNNSDSFEFEFVSEIVRRQRINEGPIRHEDEVTGHRMSGISMKPATTL